MTSPAPPTPAGTSTEPAKARAWSLPEWGAAVFGVDPVGSGGVFLRGPSGPELDGWLELARRLSGRPWTTLPPSVELDHLVGAVDLEATLASGEVRRRPGILDAATGSVIQVRWPALLSLEAAHALARARPHVALVAVQPTAMGDEEPTWSGLSDPLALWIVTPSKWAAYAEVDEMLAAVRGARGRLADVEVGRALAAEVVVALDRLGIADARTMTAALRTGRAVAALRGRHEVAPSDVEVALALVALPRSGLPATTTEHEDVLREGREASPETESAPEPGPSPREAGETGPPPSASQAQPRAESESPPPAAEPGPRDPRPSPPAPAEMMVEAAGAWLPPDVLSGLGAGPSTARSGRGSGRSGGAGRARAGRGRTLGARPGRPDRGRRLHLLETLRAAAPHQRGRKDGEPVRVRPEHLRVRVIERKEPSTVIFAVDASGSQAVARLGEVKGAVELLLSDSYRRRDHVALVVFRGDAAEVALPPTRSLTRVRRAIGSLPGGGGTPLAHGLAAVARVADSEERMGRRPTIVVLTDGRPNVAMGEGREGKVHAREDALLAARALAVRGWPTLLVDSSRRPGAFTGELAQALRGRVLRLRARDPVSLKEAVTELGDPARGRPGATP